jgi:hypothetical protein
MFMFDENNITIVSFNYLHNDFELDGALQPDVRVRG